jgi:uncharacterized protein YecT (DUF1311 family)
MSKSLVATFILALLIAACHRAPAPAPKVEAPAASPEGVAEEASGNPELVADRSEAYRKCMAGDAAAAGTSSALEGCAMDELKVQDDAVDQALQALIAKQPAPDQALARQAQNAWSAFRDAECASRAAINEGGTIQPLVIATCKTDLAILRKEDLADQADNY